MGSQLGLPADPFRRPCLAILLCCLAACAVRRNPAVIPKPGFNLYSRQQDIQIGQAAATKVRQQYQIVTNKWLEDYTAALGKRLASRRLAGTFPYGFTLLRDKQVNAFALPGGPVFVFTGLMAFADNEAQVAGVLAHEISHVALRHGTNQLSKNELFQLPALFAGAALGSDSLGQIVDAGLGIGLNGLFLRYSRNDESEADALGARIMAAAGYNPIEMARFFEKLEQRRNSDIPEFLSDHPNPGNRADEVEAIIKTLPLRSYGYSTGKFSRAQAAIRELPPSSSGRP
jgi:predicted Zn-dependent protease